MIRMRELTVVGLLALAFTGGVVGWVLWPGAGAATQEIFDPVAVQPVLQQLGPNTTLHTVEVVYRRYGAEAADVPQTEGPETQHSEAWITFDDQGVVVAVTAENRSTDGTLISTAALEGDDLVLRYADGTERHRVAGFRQNTTVETLKARIADATTSIHTKVINQPNAPSANVGERAAIVLEDRRPFTRTARPAEAAGFQLPYVWDLNPVEEVRRECVLPDEYRGVRSEVVIVSEDGTETVVESREYIVFEVIPLATSE